MIKLFRKHKAKPSVIINSSNLNLWYFFWLPIHWKYRKIFYSWKNWASAQRDLKKKCHTKEIYISVYKNGGIVLIRTPDPTIAPYMIIKWIRRKFKAILYRIGIEDTMDVFLTPTMWTCNLSVSSRFFLQHGFLFKDNLVSIEDDLINELIRRQWSQWLVNKRLRKNGALKKKGGEK